MVYDAPVRTRPSIAFAVVLAAWPLLAAKDAPPTPELEATPLVPRHVVVAVHSRAGSSQSLVAAALDLLEGTRLFQVDGSSILWYDDPDAPGEFHVMGAYSLLTTTPIVRVQEVLRSIEERLGKPGNARLLSSDILWVEGLHIETPALKLPNPAILEQPWGSDALLASTESVFAAACQEQREDRSLCSAVQKGAPKKSADVFETPVDAWIGGEFKGGRLEGWAHAHARDEEILAAAVDALVATSAARARLEWRGAEAARHLFEDAADEVRSHKAKDVFPVEVPLPRGRIEERVTAWLKAVAAAAEKDGIVLRRAVVFALGPAGARGALVGAKAAESGERIPLTSVSSVEVLEGGRAPREPRSFSVDLRVPPPKLPKPQPVAGSADA
ncbi:MAG TPA: hypothetical protein VG496_00980, partial [Myxococcales bacterium]|nr:hypothetical protein [Myxococcales bacterium]